jgi:hypothetical protein
MAQAATDTSINSYSLTDGYTGIYTLGAITVANGATCSLHYPYPCYPSTNAVRAELRGESSVVGPDTGPERD